MVTRLPMFTGWPFMSMLHMLVAAERSSGTLSMQSVHPAAAWSVPPVKLKMAGPRSPWWQSCPEMPLVWNNPPLRL